MNKPAKIETVTVGVHRKLSAFPMPSSLLTVEGRAWLSRAKAEYHQFETRDEPDYFGRVRKVREDYGKLSPAKFLERYGE
jgi:hypothetical protein